MNNRDVPIALLRLWHDFTPKRPPPVHYRPQSSLFPGYLCGQEPGREPDEAAVTSSPLLPHVTCDSCQAALTAIQSQAPLTQDYPDFETWLDAHAHLTPDRPGLV